MLLLQEYGLVRSLQLDPKAAQTWAALGRLYMQAGARHLADSCFTQARSQDPADPATWTAMGALAGLSATGGQPVASLWSVCGQSWSVCGQSVVSLWPVCGQSVANLWSVCGLPQCNRWAACGLPPWAVERKEKSMPVGMANGRPGQTDGVPAPEPRAVSKVHTCDAGSKGSWQVP